VKETGQSGSTVYNYGRGERLTTQYQILVNSRPVFFLQRVTPTSEIYSKVNSVFSIQNVKIVSLVAATSMLLWMELLLLSLLKWNIILRKEVKRRTQELEDSYDEMKSYLEEVPMYHYIEEFKSI
jgi:hypothetical protein